MRRKSRMIGSECHGTGLGLLAKWPHVHAGFIVAMRLHFSGRGLAQLSLEGTRSEPNLQ